jgi:signal transduction histidine kinase
MGSPGADRADLSIHAAHLLRDRADRVSERVERRGRGRPRQRFLADQRARLAGWSLPVIATVAALTGAIAAISLAGDSADGNGAAIAQACVAILTGAGALGVSFAKKNSVALLVVVGVAFAIACLGWGLAARMTGGMQSRFLLVAPLILVVAVGIVPLPPRVAIALAPAGYASLWVATERATVMLHFMVLAIAVGGVFVARARHKMIVRAFLRTEKLGAAVKRMRRVQEQLVVVEKLEALRVLVGGMAHELNNALAISQASSQQAQKLVGGGDSNGATAAMKRADGGLARIKATVDKLRRFAMAGDGVLEPADVAAMLDFALESAIGRARSGVIVERAYDAQVGAIRCNVAALAEALFQVARNALEAMPGGGTIRATVTREGDRVVLAVSDQGRGIPAEQLGKVFDPFWQAARKANKSGMGLSTVYALITQLGGSVKVESEEGKGTTVAIRMPMG